MSTNVKLGIAACIIAGVTAYMAYVGSAANWQYYLTVAECLNQSDSLANQPVRVSGTILPGTLERASDHSRVTFMIGEVDCKLPVRCAGPFPDNLEEAMEVVVEGRLDRAGCLQGEKLITRCASKYATAPRIASAAADSTLARKRDR